MNNVLMRPLRKSVWMARAARGVFRLVKDPTRLEEVFVLANGTESSEIGQHIVAEFKKKPEHRVALERRPRLGKVDLDALGRLPLGTLGRTFADDVRRLGIDLEDIEKIAVVKDDFDFVRAHMRETHDIWHTATGFKTDVPGELGLQSFYLAQLQAPLSAVLLAVGFLNTFFYAMEDRDARMREIVRGWLLGKRAKSLFGVAWAEMWELPLTEVRRRLRLDVEDVARAIDRFEGTPEAALEALAA
jgi:ubiquinone biosynthesis protein COQ4